MPIKLKRYVLMLWILLLMKNVTDIFIQMGKSKIKNFDFNKIIYRNYCYKEENNTSNM